MNPSEGGIQANAKLYQSLGIHSIKSYIYSFIKKNIILSIIFLIEEKNVGTFFDFRSDPDPESDPVPLFPDPNPCLTK